ncbi:MAG: membrane protein FxsA [Candidatus Aminicenantes bacterium]|nr:MAG: membrane protein FxsA [Candidatus Aminicenantes bacterium]
MFIKLLMLFTIVPVVELFLLIKVGQHIGTMNTIALIVLTGIIGASFAKSQGAKIIYQIRSTVNQGQLPGRELLQGAMILAGGILLITPGFITDLVGFSLLFPLTRQFYTDMALTYIKRKFQTGQWHVTTFPHNTYTHIQDDDENRRHQDDD